MYAPHLRELIKTVLKDGNLDGPDATELLMMTAAVESSLGHFLEQLGEGPALGIFQMEPKTETDIWENWLQYRFDMANFIRSYIAPGGKEQLKWNLAYQILMARIHYLRVPDPLPSKDDVFAMARYWKKHYNTYKGAGTIQDAVEAYSRYVV